MIKKSFLLGMSISYHMKKYGKIILVGCLVAVMCVCPLVGGFSHVKNYQETESVFVEMWHVDTFSGGKNSRGEFLKNVAVNYNKHNKTQFIVVTVKTENELLKALANGEKPDMISFGTGIGEAVLPYLLEYGGGIYSSDNFVESVTYSGKIMAVPWACGGYFRFGSGGGVTYGKEECTSPLMAEYLSKDEELKNQISLQEQSDFDSYLRYLEGGGTLIGSQRDLVRIGQRIDAGKLNPMDIVPLTKYTDLVQCIGLVQGIDSEKTSIAVDFLEYLQSENVQNTISKLRMFSTTGVKMYSIDGFSEFEKELNIIKMPCVFTPNEVLENHDKLAFAAINGDKDAQNVIHKVFE